MKPLGIVTPILLFTFCSHALLANQNKSVIDAAGRTVSIPTKVTRVICSGPGALRLLTYLGAQDLIVAVDDIEVKKNRFDARPYAIACPQLKHYPIFGGFCGFDHHELILAIDKLPQDIFKNYGSILADAYFNGGTGVHLLNRARRKKLMLSVTSLTFTYNCHPVLDKIDLSLSSGKLLAILVPNGAGKTTLLKCINAIQHPAKGTVYLDGQDVLALSHMAVARKVGYVAQQNETSRITAFDAGLMGRRPHVKWGVSKHDLRVVNAALKRLGLTDLSMRYLDEMNGGERQKIAIARALVQEPKLLLLDEPTSNLDLKNQVEILETIQGVVNNHDVAAVMTMHNRNRRKTNDL